MCGIVGLWDNSSDNNIHLKKMLGVLNHRGPDSSGIWLDTKNSIYLGHTRLTIIDQSEFGNQPMISECGKKVLIFNGEIYNFREIKNMLPSKLSFDGSSDTKVLLEAICLG